LEATEDYVTVEIYPCAGKGHGQTHARAKDPRELLLGVGEDAGQLRSKQF
jgi:hypothetical protein